MYVATVRRTGSKPFKIDLPKARSTEEAREATERYMRATGSRPGTWRLDRLALR